MFSTFFMDEYGIYVIDEANIESHGMGYGDRYTACISVDCQNVEAAARLIDAMYTEEGTNCTTWGIVDGDPILTSLDATAWTQGNGTYTVILNQLTDQDAGFYWCVTDGDTSWTSTVQLKVVEGKS